jgi:hypothetical protein
MTTDVDVCNLALARLGDARITSLSDGSAQASYCTVFYSHTLKELQTDYDWQFCRKLATATATAAPAFGYSAAYTLPADFLRLLRVNGIDEDENFGKWEIIGATLHTSLTAPIQIDYIANVTSVTTFPPVFSELFSLKLAANLAMPLTGSKELFQQLAESFAANLQRPAVKQLVMTSARERTAPAMSVDELCRQAILRLGTAEQFGSSTQAQLLTQSLYPQVRDALLLAGSWTWAIRSTTLTADLIAPEFKWDNRFALPSDCLRVYRVDDTIAESIERDWEIAGDYLLTDATSTAPEWTTGRAYAIGNAVTESGTVYRCLTAHTAGTFATDLAATLWVVWTGDVLAIEYVARVTDPAKFDSLFIDLLTSSLAAKLAVPLLGDTDKARLYTVEADNLLKNPAMRRDSTERRSRIRPAWFNSRLVAQRHAGGIP